MTSPALFEVTNARVRYNNEVVALDDLSVHFRAGERVALLGANGSGKSTLLRVLDGLLFPESGSVRFDGVLLTSEILEEQSFVFRFRRRVGLVFQNPDVQLFNPTVFDEIAFGPLQLRWPREQIREKVEEILETMGIARLRERSPHQLSGGEKKRVALASVMVLDPEVLLLDEPAAALDPRSQRQIVDLLASWSGGRKTVITATHDLESLEEISDRCLVFESGRVIGEGSALQILHDVSLLQRARLISPHRHSHQNSPQSNPAVVHPHIHLP